jgi:hypothetical protein
MRHSGFPQLEKILTHAVVCSRRAREGIITLHGYAAAN